VGVLIDFFTSYVSLPHSQAFGNRVFIKPERPVSSVDFVSRVEVYGGGGLPNFEAWSEWLGIFNLPHMALGSAVVHARLGELSVTDLGASGDDGVIVELAGASSYEMRLAPLPLPTNALVQISAKGIADSYLLQGRDFIGPFSLSNSNGSVQVAGLLGAQETNRIRIEVFEDGVFIGSATNEGGICGAIPAGDWTLTACGALPASETEHSSVYFTFDQAVTFQPADSGDALTGNELRFSWHEPGLDNGSFKNFQLQAANLPGFTITNGVTTPAPLPVLTITQLGDQVRVSWPVLIAYMFLEVSYGMDQPYSYVPGAQVVGSRWQVTLPRDPNNHQFFRLSNWCNDVNVSLNGY
jgi:hypothetical protein